jgi:tetratricopeptide (TPR) repeat protein
MRPTVQGKYNVAWFKLAEFIARGEKERAMGLYKLLSHSFDDYALGFQLAGDILLAFNDKEGLEKYKQAAELYRTQGRLLEAVGLYEQLSLLVPDDALYYTPLIDLSIELSCWKQVEENYIRIITNLVKKNEHVAARDFIHKYRSALAHISIKSLRSTLTHVHVSCQSCHALIEQLESIV